jgi:hypothetical protein
MFGKLSAVAVVVVLLAGSPMVQAAPISPNFGTFEGPGMLDGRWTESFNGGGPSMPTNKLDGASWDGAVLGGQWTLAGVTLVSDQTIFDTGVLPGGMEMIQYLTVYSGGTVTLKSGGPWTGAGDGDYVVNVNNFSLSTLVQKFGGSTQITGTVSMDGTFQANPAMKMTYLTAVTKIDGGSPAAFPANYPALLWPQGQWGSTSTTVMNIIPEPATMGVLGLGALCMLIRRRRR